MFLFILESIGTSELILIGIIALIFLGPRKLPQIAKTIGKTIADFRNTTNEFKSTWEREVDFEGEAEALRTGELRETRTDPVARVNSITEENTNRIAVPEIKPAQTELFDHLSPEQESEDEQVSEEQGSNDLSDKRNWL